MAIPPPLIALAAGGRADEEVDVDAGTVEGGEETGDLALEAVAVEEKDGCCC